MLKIIFLAFLTILIDGFDTTSIGFIVPPIAADWHLPLAAFTPVFVATSLGAALGYALSGRLAKHIERRWIVCSSIVLFALGSLVSALATTVHGLAALRLISGIGLGAAIPAVISIAVESGRQERQESVALGVTSGLSLGAAIGGLIGGPLIVRWGWPSVFLTGGIAPLLLLPAVWMYLPDDIPLAIRDPKNKDIPSNETSQMKALFNASFAPQTLLLWSFSFLIFTAHYALAFWVPSLLHQLGFDTRSETLGSAAIGIGGVISALILIPLSLRFHVRHILLTSSSLGALCLLAASWSIHSLGLLLVLIAGIGACLIAGTIGQIALAVSLYPPSLRTAGVGWSSAVGRLGSVLGPALLGLFVTHNLSPQQLFMLPIVPILAACLALLFAQRLRTADK